MSGSGAFNKLLAKHGLMHRAADIQSVSRPAIRLQAKPTDEGGVGERSRFGGIPCLPEGMEWPVGPASPMMLLAMIRLSEFAALDVPSCLPGSGLLFFWYDAVAETWGHEPAHPSCFRVDYIEDECVPLRAREFPGDWEHPVGTSSDEDLRSSVLPKHGAYPVCELVPTVAETLPDLNWCREFRPIKEPFFGAKFYTPDVAQAFSTIERAKRAIARFITARPREWGAYETLLDEMDPGNAVCHQLLGHPRALQNLMEPECEHHHRKLYGDGNGEHAMGKASGDADRSREWRLLLQLGSDEKALKWMWGDCGSLYFWIREQDLRAKRFDRTWLILQCY